MASSGEGWRLPLLDMAFCLALLGGVANFGYHALHGEYGVFAVIAAEAEERTLEARLEALRAERDALENRVARLGEDFLDLDLLDETARATLGLMRPDEATLR